MKPKALTFTVRLGLLAASILGAKPVKAEIYLHGSFAETYKGHGTDKALVAGILGMQTDDERIRFSLDVAKKEGLEIQIETGEPDVFTLPLTSALLLFHLNIKTYLLQHG